jgi:hypothetical protein
VNRTSLHLVPKPENDRKQVIDEFAELSERINWREVRRHEVLASQIRKWHADSDPSQGFTEYGNKSLVTLSPRSMQRKITSMPKLFTLLGRGVFLRHCNFALNQAEELLSGAEMSQITEVEQTGPRKLEAVPLELKKAA